MTSVLGQPTLKNRLVLSFLIGAPFAALLLAVPMAWGRGLGWSDAAILVVLYCTTMLGVTMGMHRYFTHGAFKANHAMRVALAIAGSLAVQGPPITWVADHRKHHQYADRDGDPHSPWRFGHTTGAVARGMVYAHVGWLFNKHAPLQTYAPDLLTDRTIMRISRHYWRLTMVSLLLPAALGGLLTWSWQGTVTAFFWGSLVRIALVQHVFFSINSICHVAGDRPFRARDRSGNVWWLSLPSFGDAWHNLHHADPTCARHGVLRGQLDVCARVIRWCELLGWVRDVRWPDEERLRRCRALDAHATRRPIPRVPTAHAGRSEAS
ncbi:acyl-CoA desaturase [Kitasatospora acidiphila]|uniref:acyl-CoA desaturase n=1 Tax=Kitasatospora acidiphila TaxID=2567942 RepID=UPI003C72D343